MPTEPPVPTEDDARTLLARAAATIDVDESAPMTLTGPPEPRPRRWPVMAAAAAVVMAIGSGYLVAQQLGEDPGPVPEPVSTDGEPVEQEHVYDDGELPSLLGYTEGEATDLLSRRGYALQVTAEHSCDQPAGYVLGTDPGPGTPIQAGDEVRVRVTGGPPPAARCAKQARERQAVWQQVLDLVRFARGLGRGPAFTDGVSVAVDDGPWVELERAEAREAGSWILCDGDRCHSALGALAETLTRPSATSMAVEDELTGVCRFDAAADEPRLAGLRTTYLYGEEPVDGVFCPRPPILELRWSDAHLVAVRLLLAPEEATLNTEELEASLDRMSAATQFVAWARGEGPAPEFADRVRVMYGGRGAFGSPVWTTSPETRSSYSGCSGAAFPVCGVDPVGILYRYEGPVVPTAGRSTCADGGEVPTEFAEAEGDVVRLEEPEPASCRHAWAVELWIDEDGVIYGVNQAGAVGQTGQLDAG